MDGAARELALPRGWFRREFAYAPTEVCVILGCLALNASFEPLTMVPMRRALRLVIDGKAEIVEADPDRVVRSERLTMPRPAVIRLTKFIHVPRRFRRQVTNTFLFARDPRSASDARSLTTRHAPRHRARSLVGAVARP